MPGLRIINVGGYPPPFGGVSIHLKRLMEHLLPTHPDALIVELWPVVEKKEPFVRSARSLKDLLVFFFREPRALVHVHYFLPDLKYLFVLFLISLRHRTAFSFHNERFLGEMRARGGLFFHMAAFFLNRMDAIVVDSATCRALADQFIRKKDKMIVIPEFIPPSISSAGRLPPLPPALRALREKHRVVIASNAFRIMFHKGQDTYGIDLLVEAMNVLVNRDKRDAVLLFLLPEIGNRDYFDLMNRRIANHGLAGRFVFVTEPLEEAASLWSAADLVVRATNNDGNSLTILEALGLGVPVLASDCAERPEGVALFKTRDLTDLVDRIRRALDDLPARKEAAKRAPVPNHAPAFLKLYEALGASIPEAAT